ncbi:MAG: T9SS type A sorting domain-containing protein [Bacteroidia bacterium]
MNGNAQNIPSIGKSNQLEIANWNLYWFGKTQTGYGPSNDSLQLRLIHSVILESNIDIWALNEICNVDSFQSLVSKLPEYQGVISDAFPEQKTGLIFKKSLFDLISNRSIGTENKDSFSTSRYPLEIALIPKDDIGIDTLFLIILHLKSNFGNDSLKTLAYNSRKRSSEWLKMELNKTYSNRNCIVLGDWNDDIDKSVFQGLPSPFVNLQYSDFNFYFNSQILSKNNIPTTTSYSEAIDHQLISSKLKKKYKNDSTFVFRLDRHILSYSQTCSDHYPVYSFYNTYSTSTKKLESNYTWKLFPNPSHNKIQIKDINGNCEVTLYNHLGIKIFEDKIYTGEAIDCSAFQNGFYFLKIESDTIRKQYQVQIIH